MEPNLSPAPDDWNQHWQDYAALAALNPAQAYRRKLIFERLGLSGAAGARVLELGSGQGDLSTYQFSTGTAKHTFCKMCGVQSFYVPRSHPDGISVNARCLDAGTVTGMTVAAVNGREWEKHYTEGRGSFRDA